MKAQEAEKKYWNSVSSDAKEDATSWWQFVCTNGFDIDFQEFFKDKDVLEIGCGPNGMIFWLQNAKSRAAVEPMDMPDLEGWKRSIVQHGVGEKLEYPDDSFDIVLSLNVLDHCADPEQAMKESSRVLRKSGGIMLLNVHAVKQSLRWLSKLDGAQHPHHYTADSLKALASKHFTIRRVNIVNGLAPDGHMPSRGRPKVFIGNHVMQNVFLELSR